MPFLKRGADMGPINKTGVSGSSWTLKAISLLILGACVLASGCRGSQTIGSAEAKSPDGKMIATARAYANGGFGISGAPSTFVYLNWTSGSQHPMLIFNLADESDAPDDTSVGMKWLTPTHLELTYKGSRQSVGFQAVRFADIDISVRDLSSQAANPSHP
jgi:hypothetical protein